MTFISGESISGELSRPIRYLCMVSLGLLLISWGAHPLLCQSVRIEVLALTGDRTPDGIISALGDPSIASANFTVFQAAIDVDIFNRPSAIMLDQAGDLSTLVLEPHLLPGGQEELVDLSENSVAIPLINASADILFNAGIRPADGCCPDDGLFLYDSDAGAIKTIVRDGDSAANGNGFLFVSQANQPAFNNNKQVAFWASISGAIGGLGNGSGLFRSDGGPLTRIVRTGQVPPDGESFIDALTWPTMNSHGVVAFLASIASGEEGIYRGNGGTLVEIARTGRNVPPDWEIRELTPVTGLPVNDFNKVAFKARVKTKSPSCCLDTIYLGDGATTELLAFGGQPLERSTGAVPFTISRNLALNNAGQVAFMANQDSASGIFRVDSNGLLTIAFEDDPVPGTVSGTFTLISSDDFALNDDGDVTFIASFQNGGIGRSGLFFFSDETGLIPPLVQTGSVLAGGRVDRFEFVGTNPERIRSREPSGLSEDGDVAFWFKLEDGRAGVALAEICEAQPILELFDVSVMGIDIQEACEEITVRDVAVVSGGDLTLRAGSSVTFESGFSVETGGQLQVVIDTP